MEKFVSGFFQICLLISLVLREQEGLQVNPSNLRSLFICRNSYYMRLECEGKQPVENPTVKQIKKTVLTLRSYGPHSYASITDNDGSYLQVGGGGSTCLLEFYQTETGKMFRAFGENKNKAFPDGTLLVFRAGKIPMLSDEWFMANKVAEAFCCFLENRELPDDIHWRPALISIERGIL